MATTTHGARRSGVPDAAIGPASAVMGAADDAIDCRALTKSFDGGTARAR